MAQVQFYRWELEHSVEHGRRALSLALELEMEELEELEARCRNIVAYNSMMMGLLDLGVWADAACAGDWESAYRHTLAAQATRNDSRVYVGFTRWLEVEALVRAGDSDRAVENLRQASAVPRTYPRDILQQVRGQAVLRLATGDRAAAVMHLEQAGALAGELGLLNDRWQLEAALADIHAAAGASAVAQAHNAAAAALIRDIEALSVDDPLWAQFEASTTVRRVMGRA